MEMTLNELGYIAGLVDGEGSIMIHKTPNYSVVTIVIYNSKKELLTWLHARLSGYMYFCQNRKSTFLHRKPVGMWRLTGKRCVEILRLIRPFLVIKGYQADLAIQAYCLIQAQKKSNSNGKSLPLENIVQRKNLYDLMRLSNS